MDKAKRWKMAAIAMAVILAAICLYSGIGYLNYQVASYGFSQGVNSTINQGTQALLQQGYISWPVPYFNQTKEHIVELTRRYVPTERAAGMAQVYIPSDVRIKWFQPSTCTFFGEKADKDGYIVKSAIDTMNDGKPCYNQNTTTIYSWDYINGNVTSHQAVNYPKIQMPANSTVNPKTGIIENKTVSARQT